MLATLAKPFEPPTTDLYRPVFSHGQWEVDFKEMANTNMYIVYFGPSDLGKYLAVQQALKGRPGVVYINLQENKEDNIPNEFASALVARQQVFFL